MHVMPIVTAFLDAHPQTTAELSLEDRPVDLVEEGIDLALRIAHLDMSSLVARRVGAVRRVVVASPRYLKRHGRPADPTELSARAIVLFANQANGPLWQFQASDGTKRQVRVNARFQVNRAEAAIAAACDGKGVTRVLSYQVAAELARGRLVRVLQEFEQPPIPVHIVFATTRLMAPRVRAFLDFAVPRLAVLPVLRGN
jgi:DNA-binding transcriptional LysR family regulator